MQENPRPARKSDDLKVLKVGSIVVAGAIIAFLLLKSQMQRDWVGKVKPDEKPAEETRAPRLDVKLAPRPVRLFHEYVKAVMLGDRTAVEKLSELSLRQIDILVTEERKEILEKSVPGRLFTLTEEKIDGEKAVFAAVFKNPRGLEVMGLRLTMAQRGGAESWKVTAVEDQWYAESGKVPEFRFVALGGDRKDAQRPLDESSSFHSLPEADPQPLDWLPGTSEEMRTAIEAHMRDILDFEHPAKLSKASRALAGLGKDAIPRILTEIAKYDVRNEEDNRRVNALERTLAAMTDLEFGYDAVGLEGGVGPITPAQARVRAIRRWFGWWLANKDKPLPKREAAPDAEPK